MKQFFEQVEKAIQTFFEDSIRILPSNISKKRLVHEIVRQITEILFQYIQNNQPVPTHFEILIHPDDLENEFNNPNWIEGITHGIKETAVDTGVILSAPLSLLLKPTREVSPGEVLVQELVYDDKIEQTAVIELNTKQPDVFQNAPKAFLILPDKHSFNLQGKMVQIGRKKENDLVIDHPSISRNHAQIRLIRGKYVIFDLGSTGGTMVNSLKINKAILKPGDVISLADYAFIYGEEGDGKTTPHDPTTELPKIVNKE
jgi:hypothetical protein